MASIISAGTTSGTALNMAGDTSGVLQLATNGSTTALTINTSQNVGIGTSSPSAKLDVSAGTNLNLGITQLALDNYSNEGIGITFSRTSSDDDLMALGVVDTQKLGMFSREGIVFATGGGTNYSETTERMRITSSGNLLVGTADQQTGASGKLSIAGGIDGVAGVFTNNSNGSAFTIQVFNYTTATGGGTGRFVRFASGSTPTQVGSISGDGTNTTYSTSSDYRLKENIAPMTGALATVAQLKPVTYTWKLNGSAGNGFIAHELQAVCPQAVIGEKDAVDENGNIEPQGIDTSFLVATLTAAIQEQQTIINDLKARVTALEGAA
jgi:hypothetical protein